MNKTILESLIESGGISEGAVVFALLKSGKINLDDILAESGITDAEMLISLHRSDEVNVVKLITETVRNIKVSIDSMTSGEAATELRRTAVYLESLAVILEDVEEEPYGESAHSISEVVMPSPITVVRSVS